MSTKIGAYARISLDGEGEGLGVARQKSDTKKLAALREWVITDTYTDNNISAFKTNVKRPEFERMLEDLSSGVIDGIVAYDLDRVVRQPADLERIVRIYEQRKGLVFATVQGSIDLSTGDGLTMARVLVAFANKSSMDSSRRIKRKNQERAEAGLPHGSRRPYGYNDDQLTVHPIEGPILHEMGMKFVSGISYKDIAYWMNESGHKTTMGKLWYPITVRNMLSHERYAGYRTHEGVVHKGIWKPVFTADEWEAIRFTAKRRKEVAGDKPVAKRYLLTGIATCGKCGGHLNGATKRDKPTRPLRPTYHCRVSGDTERRGGGCGGVTRNADALEHFIRELICARLDTVDLAALVEESGSAKSELPSLIQERDLWTVRKDALLDDYVDGTLSKPEYVRSQKRIEDRVSDLDRKIDELHRQSLNVSLNAGETVREAWNTRPNSWKQELIGTLISSIVVNVGKTKPYYEVDGVRMRFDPNLVDVAWKA